MKVLVTLVLVLLCCGITVRAEVPVVGAEVLQDGFSLERQWQFRPGDDLAWAAPEYDSTDWVERDVPGRWRAGGYPESNQMAWYRLTLKFDLQQLRRDQNQQEVAIKLGKITSAYELYAGGRLLGGVGKLPPEGEVVFDRKEVIRIPPDAIAADGTLVLSLRVWGGDSTRPEFWRGGPYQGEFKLGGYRNLLLSGLASELPGLLVGVMFLGFGFYHLYLYSRNRQLESYLWYGLLAINIGIYSLMLTQWKYMFDWPFLVLKKTELAAIYIFPALAIQLVFSLLQQPIGAWLRVYQCVFVAFLVAVIAVPGHAAYYYTLPVWQYSTVPILVAIAWVVSRQALAGNREARTVVIGVMLFAATCINDLLIDMAGIGSTRLVPFGFVAIMLAMSASLANRLTGMLAGLEMEVAQRTEALSEANEQLAAAARVDPLTNLLNRRGFSAEASDEIDRMYRTGRAFNLVLADVDHFKNFNDRHGHACGDHVLIQAAAIFRSKVRAVDRVGRWGGEEFILLLPETGLEGASALAEKLRLDIADNIFEYSGQSLSITMTFGVARFEKGESLDNCIARADAALYRAKKLGRNQVLVCGIEGITVAGELAVN